MTELVECVPNFSEGRDKTVIDAIARAISGVNGVRLLDVDPGVATPVGRVERAAERGAVPVGDRGGGAAVVEADLDLPPRAVERTDRGGRCDGGRRPRRRRRPHGRCHTEQGEQQHRPPTRPGPG